MSRENNVLFASDGENRNTLSRSVKLHDRTTEKRGEVCDELHQQTGQLILNMFVPSCWSRFALLIFISFTLAVMWTADWKTGREKVTHTRGCHCLLQERGDGIAQVSGHLDDIKRCLLEVFRTQKAEEI